MAEKGPSKGQKSKFRKTGKNLFSHSPKEHIFKKLGCWVENCGLQLGNRQTDTHRQTKKQRQRQPFQGFRAFLTSAHHQGARRAVQKMLQFFFQTHKLIKNRHQLSRIHKNSHYFLSHSQPNAGFICIKFCVVQHTTGVKDLQINKLKNILHSIII